MQQQQQQDQPTSHLVRLLAATWPPTRLLVCLQTPTALLAPPANSGTTTGGGAFAAGRTPCRAAVIAKGVRRSKQYIARKELQKRAKEEYLRRIYEVNPSSPPPPCHHRCSCDAQPTSATYLGCMAKHHLKSPHHFRTYSVSKQ